jgi:membrane protein DedA with SNARE-associated domain
VLIGVISAIGKTIGCLIFYFAADKAEDFFTSRFGKFVGVSHKDIEGIGQKFKGGWKDEVALFFIRFAPFMPTTPISVACGIVKMPLKSYIGATLLGTFFRGMLYLYLGYMGESSSTALVKNFNGLESLLQILILLAIVAVFGWIVYKKKKVEKATE